MTLITPPQCRAARGLLDMSQSDLADAARVGLSTVSDFESGKRTPIANNLAAIQSALEDAGILFIRPDKSGGIGVRVSTKETKRAKPDEPRTSR